MTNELRIEYLSAASLNLYPRNARTHSKKQIKQIADSIKQNGFTNPILIDENSMIMAGHGRLAAAILIAIESIHLIMTPHKTPKAYTLIILIVVIVVKELMFRYVEKTANDIGSTAVKGDAWHHRSDAITSFTAAIGITIALIGGEGYESADDWAALIAAVLIVYKIVSNPYLTLILINEQSL